jgi:hypothetical protein
MMTTVRYSVQHSADFSIVETRLTAAQCSSIWTKPPPAKSEASFTTCPKVDVWPFLYFRRSIPLAR